MRNTVLIGYISGMLVWVVGWIRSSLLVLQPRPVRSLCTDTWRGGCSSDTHSVNGNNLCKSSAYIPHWPFLPLAVQGMQETVKLFFGPLVVGHKFAAWKDWALNLSLTVTAVQGNYLWQTLFSLIGYSLEMLVLFYSFILCVK